MRTRPLNFYTEELTEFVFEKLRSEGMKNPAQYVPKPEYIFSARASSEPGDTYDVVVRYKREVASRPPVPPSIYRCFARALREVCVGERATVLQVQFEVYSDGYCCFLPQFIDSFDNEPLGNEPLGLNNCSFKQESTILHDELRFRSKGEIAIHDELKQRNVLFFPNPAAVLGTSGTQYGEKVQKLEPDFLVCCNGKWGILEINGDNFHSGIVKTTKDHERARRFNHYGLFFVQAYDADKCKADPVNVVDEFLKLLAGHKA